MYTLEKTHAHTQLKVLKSARTQGLLVLSRSFEEDKKETINLYEEKQKYFQLKVFVGIQHQLLSKASLSSYHVSHGY